MKRALLLLLCCGCASVGPDFESPAPRIAESFDSSPVAAELDRREGPAVDLTAWWTSFDDPVLVDLIDRATAENLDLAQAEARLREARAIRRAVRGADGVQVDGTAGYARQRGSENGAIDLGALAGAGIAERTIDLHDISVGAAWEVDLFGGVRRRRERVTAELERAIVDTEAVRVSIAAEVARTYFELRGREAQRRVVGENVANQAATVERIRAKRTADLVPELDVTRAEAQWRATRALLPPLEAAVAAGRYRLAVLVGETPGALDATLDGEIPLPTVAPRVPIGLPSELLKRRPDVLAAHARLHAATAAIGERTADLYPRFFLTGGAGYESTDLTDLFDAGSEFFSIGPRITWPIFRSGALRAQVRAAEARRDQAFAAFQQTVLVAVEEVERGVVSYVETERARREWAEAQRAAERSVELANDLYESGLGEFLDVLTAEGEQLRIEEALVREETAVAVALVRLYRALGGGWDAQRREEAPVARSTHR